MNFIIHEIRKKNEKVFKNFYEKHYIELLIRANGYLFDKDTSKDMVQEVFIYVWENASSLNIKSSLIGYMHTMVKNRCLNYLKSIKVTENLEILEFNINLMSDQSDSVFEKEKQGVYRDVLEVVDALPEKMRQIVKLKFINNYKYSEIAEELNISTNTVKTQLKRAKIKMTELLSLIFLLIQVSS